MLLKSTIDAEDSAYASAATTYYGAKPEHWEAGVVPFNTLPAADWNWMWRHVTQAVIDGKADVDAICSQLVALGEAIGVEVTSAVSLTDIIEAYVTRLASSSVAGAVVSSSDEGKILVAEDGTMTVNGLDASVLSSVNSLQEAADSAASSVASLESSVGALESSVSSLESSLPELSENVESVLSGTAALEAMQTALATLEEKVSALENAEVYPVTLDVGDGDITLIAGGYEQGGVVYSVDEEKYCITGDAYVTSYDSPHVTVQAGAAAVVKFDMTVHYDTEMSGSSDSVDTIYAIAVEEGASLHVRSRESLLRSCATVEFETYDYVSIIHNLGSVVIDDGEMDCAMSLGTYSRGAIVHIDGEGTLVVNGGYFRLHMGYIYGATQASMFYLVGTGSVDVNDGDFLIEVARFYPNIEGSDEFRTYAAFVENTAGTATISGGFFEGTAGGLDYYGDPASYTYLAGMFTWGEAAVAVIAGGTFHFWSGGAYYQLLSFLGSGSLTVAGAVVEGCKSYYCLEDNVVYNRTTSVTIKSVTHLQWSPTMLMLVGVFMFRYNVSMVYSGCYVSAHPNTADLGYAYPVALTLDAPLAGYGMLYAFPMSYDGLTLLYVWGNPVLYGDVATPAGIALALSCDITVTGTFYNEGFLSLNGYTITGNVVNHGTLVDTYEDPVGLLTSTLSDYTS